MPYKLTTDDMDALADILDRTRKSSTTVTVPRELFAKLLTDHSKALAEIDGPFFGRTEDGQMFMGRA